MIASLLLSGVGRVDQVTPALQTVLGLISPIGHICPILTPFPELDALLEELAGLTQKILSENHLGTYLHGSFALGDADAHSDVDFIVVTKDDLTPIQQREIRAMHEWLYDRDTEWAKHLEGSYFPAARVRDHHRAGGELFYLDNGARELIFSDHCDTVVVRWILREYGVPLAGPDPKTLVDPIPPGALRAEIREVVRDYGGKLVREPGTMDSRWHHTFAVVLFCRMLHSLQTGRIDSKKAGVEWALRTLAPQWHGLIERAWARRPDTWRIVHESADAGEVEETVAFVREALRTA